jgi:hypothetical protein
MDCEAFEASMMDDLYGELDELTGAAMKRHASGCSRCAELLEGLRATRRLATLPMVDVPAGLTERILAAAEVQTVVPMRRRAARAISIAGTWAMRPQSAMAAVFMVMLGTSLLLLRGRSSRAPADSEVTVTEHGTPAPATPSPVAQAAATDMPQMPPAYGAASAAPPALALRPPEAKAAAALPLGAVNADQALDGRSSKAAARVARDDESAGAAMGGGGGAFAAPPTAAAPAPAQAEAFATRGASVEPTASPFDTAVKLYESGRFDEATRAFEALAGQDVNADLYAARSIREGKGCRSAVARFDRVAQRGSGSPPGWDALLEGAICYRSIGDFADARVRLTPLLSIDSHKDRARAEIDRLGDVQAQGNAAAAPAKAAKPRAAQPSAAGGAPASPPADVGGQ